MRTLLFLSSLSLALTACDPYYDRPYGGSSHSDHHGFDSVGPHTDRDGRPGYGSYDSDNEARRHAHIDAEREHLREKEADESRRHSGYHY